MLFAVSMAWSSTVLSQDAPKAVPVELFTCSFQDGKDMDDLNKVIARFNKWSDQHNPAYTAWVITPQFRSSDDEFQLGWIGAWADGTSMGEAWANI